MLDTQPTADQSSRLCDRCRHIVFSPAYVAISPRHLCRPCKDKIKQMLDAMEAELELSGCGVIGFALGERVGS